MAEGDTTMLAAWLEDGALRVRPDVPMPRPGPEEALVRVRLAGICGTDLQLLGGYASFRGIPGHEFVGDVVAGASSWVGRRVVAEINVGCGHCSFCLAAQPGHCATRHVLGIRGLDGAFAAYVRVPAANLHEVPERVDDQAAVFTEPLAAACRVADQLPNLDGANVVVLGAGRLGQLVARVLALRACAVTATTRSAHKQQLLPPGVTPVTPIDLEPRAFDVAVDCTGHADGAESARRALRPGGTLVLKSTHGGAPQLDLGAIVVDEIRVIGSRCGPFATALQLLSAGLVDPRPLIDATMPLADAAQAMAAAAAPGALKILLAP